MLRRFPSKESLDHGSPRGHASLKGFAGISFLEGTGLIGARNEEAAS